MLKLVIIGNLGADAEVKNENGNRFLSFRVADTITLKSKNEQVTTWISCSKNSNFDNLVPFLKKGTKVYCSGRLSTRLYVGHDGVNHAGLNLLVNELVLCGGKNENTDKDENAPF